MLFNNLEFNDPNYTNIYVPYPTNNFTTQEPFQANDNDLQNNYIGNDTLTSLCVGRGWQVILYEHVGYGGNYLWKGAGCYNLSNDPFPGGGTWNDKVSSLLVYPP